MKNTNDILLRRTMTKKAYDKLNRSRRAVNGFNTGTRTHKSAKDYSRKYVIPADAEV